MTGVKRSGKMSPYEGDGDIEQERTEEANGLEQGGGGGWGAGAFGSPSQEAFGTLQKGGRSSFGIREPGQKPSLTDPMVLNKGSTALDAAESIHKDFGRNLKYARVWGSGKFDGQEVKREYVLQDGDVIELHI